MSALCSMELLADMVLCENGVEQLNVVGFCSRKLMGEFLGLRFLSDCLLFCWALHRDMYNKTSKDWGSEGMLRWLRRG